MQPTDPAPDPSNAPPSERFCRFCGLIETDNVNPVCSGDESGANRGSIHAWLEGPAFPSDLDMKNLLSETDAADIASLSADQKADRRRMFTSAMGRMLADITGTTSEEKDAIAEGYTEMLNKVFGEPDSGNPGLLGYYPGGYPGGPITPPARPPSPPTPPSSIATFFRYGIVEQVDFAKIIGPAICIRLSLDPISTHVESFENEYDLGEAQTLALIRYLIAVRDFFIATAAFSEARNYTAMVPGPSGSFGVYSSALTQASDINYLLAIPQLQPLIARAKAEITDASAAPATESIDEQRGSSNA